MAGSMNLRRYVADRRAGMSREEAAEAHGIPIAEAAMWDADEDKGELAWVEPPPPPIGHNSKDQTMSNGNVAGDQLRLFLERIERLEEEKKGIQDDIKDVYLEAKSQGYDPKIMREIVRERKMDKDKRDEREALLETYRAALGMLSDTPLGAAAMARAA